VAQKVMGHTPWLVLQVCPPLPLPPLLLLPKPPLPLPVVPHWLPHDCWQLLVLMLDAHCVHSGVSAFGMQPWKQFWSPWLQAQKQVKKSLHALTRQLPLQFCS
jgi:hypothetical protein